MKKILTLVAAMALVASAAQAQRISNLVITEGEATVYPLSKCGSTNPSATANGEIQMVFAADQSFNNLTVVPEGCNLVSTMPTDFTNKVMDIEVADKTDASKTAKYNIQFKHISPIDIPEDGLTFKFGGDGLTEGQGWSGSQFGPGSEGGTSGSLGMIRRGLVLAFNDPGTLTFSIKGTGDGWADGTIVDVEETADGINWTSVVTFNDENKLSTALTTNNYDLNLATKYVRFIYTNKPSGSKVNISIDKIKVTKGQGSNISNNTAAQASAFVANGELNIVNANEVAKVEVFNIAGLNALTQVRPANTISLNALSNGVYLVRLTTIDGNVATSKVAIK